MNQNFTMPIKGIEYPLAANLRVAYKLQGSNNHKPYTQIFSDMADMPVEKQIELLYISLCVGTPDFEKQMQLFEFTNYCLDNMNVADLMTCLKKIMAGIMGKEYKENEEDEDNESVDTYVSAKN